MLERIGLWGCSFAVGVVLFSLLCCLSNLSLRSSPTIAIITALFALPAWLLCIPLVVIFRNTTNAQIWILLITGVLIGPVYLAGLGLIVQLSGHNPHKIWYGGGIDIGILPSMPFALVLGLLTSTLYVAGLKLFRRR